MTDAYFFQVVFLRHGLLGLTENHFRLTRKDVSLFKADSAKGN
jgi:hypothetical protein